MSDQDDKQQALDERNIKAAAILDSFSIEEMEKILQTDVFELMALKSEFDQTQKDQLMKVFERIITNRVLERIFDFLSEEELEEFDKLINVDDMTGADKYLADKGINKEQITMTEIVLFKLELAHQTKEVA